MPCVVGVLVVMFTVALEDRLKFVVLEKVMTVLVVGLQVGCLILLCRPRFVTKREFVFYEVVLALNVLILGQKCTFFVAHEDDDSKIKDILLLSLTTQIALSIVFMEFLN